LYKDNDTVIVKASRTAIGNFNGVYADTPAYKLGSAVIKSLIDTSEIKSTDIDEVILGQILTSGQGQNPARQAAVDAGLPYETLSWSINQLCASGLKSVILAHQQISEISDRIIIAGGQENMTRAPHVVDVRRGHKMGTIAMQDTMINDALIDFFNDYHMGVTAENVAKKWSISRSKQDNFAFESQQKAIAAYNAGKFAEEICPVTITKRKKEETILEDEYIRHNINMDDISSLKPIFKKDDGTVTAANASGINDGAAGLLLMSYKKAKMLGLDPLVKIVSWGQAGVDPSIMGTGPIPAIKNALTKIDWSINEIDIFELNEAFASQSLACIKDLKIDQNKVNIDGGALALGHPLGATGARITGKAAQLLKRENKRYALATQCIGLGMGIATIIESVE
jgi:acetyl-CoA C-acetyltransferase